MIFWEEFTYLEKLGGEILDLMSEFEEMDIQKERKEASKVYSPFHGFWQSFISVMGLQIL